MTPEPTWLQTRNSAARTDVGARLRDPSRAASASPARSPGAGTSATRGRARPRRSGCRSGRACAAPARSAPSARSARAPRRCPRAGRHRAAGRRPSRRPRFRAPRAARASASNTSYGTIGGAWFRTSCVDALVSTWKSLLAELDEGGDQRLAGAAVRGGRRAQALARPSARVLMDRRATLPALPRAPPRRCGSRAHAARRRARRPRARGRRRRGSRSGSAAAPTPPPGRPARRSGRRRAPVPRAPAGRTPPRPRRRAPTGQSRLRDLHDHVELALRGAPEHLGEEVALRGEVAVDGAHRHAGLGRHGLDTGRGIAAAGDLPSAAATIRSRVASRRASVFSVGR